MLKSKFLWETKEVSLTLRIQEIPLSLSLNLVKNE